MSEPKADEQYLEQSDTASRKRMTDLDWVCEAMRDDGLIDEIEPTFFLQQVMDIYKKHNDDPSYIGVAVMRIISNEAETLGLRNRDEFNQENNNV